MKKVMIVMMAALMIGTAFLIGNVSAENYYTIDDVKNLQDFLLAKDTPDLSGKDYDLDDDGVWNVFDLCLMKRKFADQIPSEIDFGTTKKDDFIVDNVLHSETQGDIHFSSYIPESYDGSEPYALFVTLPGWEGLYFQGVGANLYEGFPFEAKKYNEKMIILSTQLDDWGETSADMAIALTEYFIEHYNIDTDKIYLHGMSGGGETGSIIMGKRPELFTAYLETSSRWDGDLNVLAEARTPVYMAIAENDTYYGSDYLKNAYHELYDLYKAQGLSDAEIDASTETAVTLAITSADSSQTMEATQNKAESAEKTDSGEGSKILIAYFTAGENSGVDASASASYSMVNGEAKGRIRALADMIQAETGGDLFSIQTSVVYPSDGGELIDYADQEQSENASPELTSHIENLVAYDTIFVGYPNWWYDMPMAMYSFFDEYDFSGKTIIPFNSHNGSRFSGTIETIQELEPNATIITDGFTVNEHDVPDAAGDIAEWIDELGY